MASTSVVNIKKEAFDVYIGRSSKDPMHFGNPFSIGKSKVSNLVVGTRSKAIKNFFGWLDGEVFQDVEPERRAWILDNLDKLKGQRIGCHCKPFACHGDIYRVFLGEITLAEVLDSFERKEEQLDLFS